MKITKQRLKEIIKEELHLEGGPTFDMSGEELVNEAQLALRQLDEG